MCCSYIKCWLCQLQSGDQMGLNSQWPSLVLQPCWWWHTKQNLEQEFTWLGRCVNPTDLKDEETTQILHFFSNTNKRCAHGLNTSSESEINPIKMRSRDRAHMYVYLHLQTHLHSRAKDWVLLLQLGSFTRAGKATASWIYKLIYSPHKEHIFLEHKSLTKSFFPRRTTKC